jgi:hypothetical protein
MPASYADRINGLATSVAVKAPCRVVATSAITASGLQTIDGVTLAAGDRVLRTADGVDNGIWVAASGAWSRAKDFDGARDVVTGTLVVVTAGTSYGQTDWWVTTAGEIAIGTTAITFAQGPFAAVGTTLQAANNLSEVTDDTAARRNIATETDHPVQVATIAALRLLGASAANYLTVYVRGYYADADGGEGAFWYDSTDAASADNGGTIVVDASGRRWKRSLPYGQVSVLHFGAKGDAATDDVTAFENASAWCGITGHALIVPPRIYRFTATWDAVPKSLSILCPGGNPWRASQYGDGHGGAVIFFDGTAGQPALKFSAKGANNEQSAGHILDGITFIGGHVEFGEYNTWNVVRNVAVHSRAASWLIGSAQTATNLAAYQAVANGSLKLDIDGVQTELSTDGSGYLLVNGVQWLEDPDGAGPEPSAPVPGLVFTSATTLQDVARIIDDATHRTSLCRCFYLNGRFVLVGGPTSINVATVTTGTGLNGNNYMGLNSGVRAGRYNGRKLCAYGINLAGAGFNTLLSGVHLSNINGNSIYVADNNGNLRIEHVHIGNRSATYYDGAITDKNSLIVIKSTGGVVTIRNCDLEPMVADNLIRTESINVLNIRDCYMELPNVLGTDVNCFIQLGTTLTYTARSVLIEGNFMQGKGKVSRCIDLQRCDRGVTVRANEILNFQYPLYVSATATDILGDVIYDGIQGYDTDSPYPGTGTVAQIGGATEKVDTKGTVQFAWSPTLTTDGVAFTSVTYGANRAGLWSRNGNWYAVSGYMITDAVTVGAATGNIRMSLPCVPRLNVTGQDGATTLPISNTSGFASGHPYSLSVTNGGASAALRKRATSNGADAPVVVADVGTGANANAYRFSGMYAAPLNT